MRRVRGRRRSGRVRCVQFLLLFELESRWSRRCACSLFVGLVVPDNEVKPVLKPFYHYWQQNIVFKSLIYSLQILKILFIKLTRRILSCIPNIQMVTRFIASSSKNIWRILTRSNGINLADVHLLFRYYHRLVILKIPNFHRFILWTSNKEITAKAA